LTRLTIAHITLALTARFPESGPTLKSRQITALEEVSGRRQNQLICQLARTLATRDPRLNVITLYPSRQPSQVTVTIERIQTQGDV